MSSLIRIWRGPLIMAALVVLPGGLAEAQGLEVRGELSIGTPAPAAPAAPASLDTQLQNLTSTDPAVRLEAARALGELGDPAAVGPLSQTARSDPRPEVRGWALRALHQIGTPEAIAAIRAQATADTDERVRTLATQLVASVEPAAAPAEQPGPAPAAPPAAPAPQVQPGAGVVVQPQGPQPVVYPQEVGVGQVDYLTYRMQQRAGRGLRIAGWISFGVLYGASFIAAISISAYDGADEGWPLFLPVVGPYIMGGRLIADAEYCDSWGCYDDEEQRGAGVAAIMVGLLETAGFAMLVAGYVRRARARRQGAAAQRTLAIVPGGPAADGPGLSLAGTF